MLKKILENTLTSKESDELISAFDQIGNIIIVRIPDSLLSKKKIIGETLLNEVKVARSVFYQVSDVEGDFRTRNLEILAGEDNTETEYKEFGCKFLVDVENAFFSPRLSTERERIGNLVQDGEVITNMFAGVGMFSIMAAKKKKCTVYSLDINPAASNLCVKNIELNKLAGKVISINGDVSLEVVSTEYSGMMEEGKRLREYGDNVVVKVPMTPDGLKACKSLSSEGIPVNVTLIFSPNQALLAAKSGAKYVSPFIGRLDDIGQDGMHLIKEIKEIFSNYNFGTKILVASIRHPIHVIDAAKIGADVVTLPPVVLDKMMQHPLTKIGLENFLADWEKLKAGNSDIKI